MSKRLRVAPDQGESGQGDCAAIMNKQALDRINDLARSMRSQRTRVRVTPPKLRLTPSVHFVEQLSDRRFDLSILIPAYQAMTEASVGTEKEFSIGRSSVVAVKTAEGEALLKTGWKGDRTKR